MKQEAEVEAEDGTGPGVAESEGDEGLKEGARRFAPEDISRSLLFAIRSASIGVLKVRANRGAVTISDRSHTCSRRSISFSTSTSVVPSFEVIVRQ